LKTGNGSVWMVRKKEFKNIWNWYIFIFIMILLGKIWKFLGHPFDNPQIIDLLTFYVVVLGLVSTLIGCFVRRYLTNHPFKMDFSDEDFSYNGERHYHKSKTIQGVDGLFPITPLTLRIKLRTERNFEQINIRLVQRRYFSDEFFRNILRPVFWYWVDTPTQSVSIEKIADPKVEADSLKTGRHFYDGDDSRGGREGYYDPPYHCPQGNYLWYQVKLNINPDIDKWGGYISFQHLLGDSHRAYGRRQIIIKNTKSEVKEFAQSPKADL
jgi:hypothetical protein